MVRASIYKLHKSSAYISVPWELLFAGISRACVFYSKRQRSMMIRCMQSGKGVQLACFKWRSVRSSTIREGKEETELALSGCPLRALKNASCATTPETFPFSLQLFIFCMRKRNKRTASSIAPWKKMSWKEWLSLFFEVKISRHRFRETFCQAWQNCNSLTKFSSKLSNA